VGCDDGEVKDVSKFQHKSLLWQIARCVSIIG
jgi:hypothetical protein